MGDTPTFDELFGIDAERQARSRAMNQWMLGQLNRGRRFGTFARSGGHPTPTSPDQAERLGELLQHATRRPIVVMMRIESAPDYFRGLLGAWVEKHLDGNAAAIVHSGSCLSSAICAAKAQAYGCTVAEVAPPELARPQDRIVSSSLLSW